MKSISCPNIKKASRVTSCFSRFKRILFKFSNSFRPKNTYRDNNLVCFSNVVGAIDSIVVSDKSLKIVQVIVSE